MKGLLYCDFLLNKKWFLGAGIVTVIGAAALFISYSILYNEIYGDIVISLTYLGVQAIVAFSCTEWLGRSLESNIKCRFTDYVLTSGISKRTFAQTELAKNLLSSAISYFMCMVVQLAVRLHTASLFTPIALFDLILIVGILRWITSLVTLSLRNAELSGLIVAIAFIIVVILLFQIPRSYTVIDDVIYGEIGFLECIFFLADIFPFHYVCSILLAYLAVIAVIYVIVYVLFLHRIRKGDVCK